MKCEHVAPKVPSKEIAGAGFTFVAASKRFPLERHSLGRKPCGYVTYQRRIVRIDWQRLGAAQVEPGEFHPDHIRARAELEKVLLAREIDDGPVLGVVNAELGVGRTERDRDVCA